MTCHLRAADERRQYQPQNAPAADDITVTETTKQALRQAPLVLQPVIASGLVFDFFGARLRVSVTRLFLALPVCIGVYRQQNIFIDY